LSSGDHRRFDFLALIFFAIGGSLASRSHRDKVACDTPTSPDNDFAV
jgi:hypothetical protein